jgi:protein CMS1
MSDSEQEGGVPLIEAQFDVDAPSKKRKREGEPEASKDSKKAAKKAKRKEKKKQRQKAIDEDDLDQQMGVNHAFERMDGQLVADYVNARTRLYGKELSSVELEDKFISGRCASADVFERRVLTRRSAHRTGQHQLERATNYRKSIGFSQEAGRYA